MGNRSGRARWTRYVRGALAVVAAFVMVSVSAAHAASPRPGSNSRADGSPGVPVLGVTSVAPAGAGFGEVRPRTISYGGDPTSFVSKVTWQSWGAARAIGHGTADWVWPGWCVACGSDELPATVVAFGRTTCQGRSAYSEVEWYFPSRGMSFSRRLANGDICGGRSTPVGSVKESKCGRVSLPSHGSADDIDMFDSPISCATARRFVAASGAQRYLHRNARFGVDGWWCGSELSMDFGGVQSFSCVQGDFTNVSFDLESVGG